MEFGKFLSEALEKGNVEEVSNLFDHFFRMIINAFGMMEKREIELEKRITSLERGIDTIIDIYSFHQSMINTIKNNLDEIKSLIKKPTQLPLQSKPVKTFPDSFPTTPKEPIKASKPLKPVALQADIKKTSGPISEEEIDAFRKSILKPTPPPEKIKKKPTSIRAELIDEMKGFFEAVKKSPKKGKNQ
ncbi:MAG: hypothetical protein HWN67_18595 [Candidatus Helarchaeota archaeon]|nr:hypothetical protein [Candidatus Helarchaeota archaeon]